MPGSYAASTAFPFRLNVILGIGRPLDGIIPRFTYEAGGPQWINPGRPTNGSPAPGAICRRCGKTIRFAPKIKIHDVTLRDGEQQTAVVFRREEKVAIAKQLDALGIHRIEAGMPAVSPQDKAAISDIAALGLKAEVFAFSRCIPEEIKVVKEVGCKGVVVEIPASDHMIKNAYGWSVDRAMKSSIDTTLAAKEAGLYTVFFTIDATRTELNRFLDIVDQVATEGHMDALTMADTMGVCTPDADQPRRAESDRPAEEAGRDSLPSGLRARRGEHGRRARRRRIGRAHDGHGPRRTRRQRADGRRRDVAALPATASTSASTRRSSARSRSS